jgi:2-polyprenyl-3-methyl-5-hydroxy-6-metoxy-1,4-benzoquinol methylase
MSESPIFELAGKHYDEAAFQMELDRLPIAAPVKMHITLSYLARYVPDAARVCEIGVGGGIYSLALAQRGCALHFVDVSRHLLKYVEKKIREAGLGPQIVGCTYASATDLAAIDSADLDVVLLLGPLYHLLTEVDRRSAVAESRRLLRSGGLLFAAGINRISALRELFRDFSNICSSRPRWQPDGTSFAVARLTRAVRRAAFSKAICVMATSTRNTLRQSATQTLPQSGNFARCLVLSMRLRWLASSHSPRRSSTG